MPLETTSTKTTTTTTPTTTRASILKCQDKEATTANDNATNSGTRIVCKQPTRKNPKRGNQKPEPSAGGAKRAERLLPIYDCKKSITQRRHSRQKRHQQQQVAAKPRRTMKRETLLLILSLSLSLAFSLSQLDAVVCSPDATSNHHHHHHHSTPVHKNHLPKGDADESPSAESESSTRKHSSTWTTTVTIALDNGSSGGSNNVSARIKVPGLYDERENPWITPLQGQVNFERLIYNASDNKKPEKEGEATSQISLIQYYMATCPDCQGFSPYFKRFVSDIGAHWRHLVRVYTINCNDEININLCWQQNPNLIVPLVRWYTFSEILADSRQSSHAAGRKFKNYPADLLNVAHRGYIKKQRRDLISLRHATLRYIESVLEQLQAASNTSSPGGSSNDAGQFYSKLPIRMRLLRPLGGQSKAAHSSGTREAKKGDDHLNDFAETLIGRTKECSRQINNGHLKHNVTIDNFIVFEKPGSYVGKTFVADWSNWTCAENKNRVFMFHYSDNLNLLTSLKILDSKVHSSSNHARKVTMDHKEAHSRQPLLLAVETSLATNSLEQLEFHLLASNHSSQHHSSGSRARRSTATLERYYGSRSAKAGARSSRLLSQQVNGIVKKRLRRSSPSPTGNDTKIDYNEAENINWAPEYVYPGEELIRYRFNQIVAHRMNKSAPMIMLAEQIPGAEFRGENPGEIERIIRNGSNSISSKDDDLTLLKLTDYYKVLDEIIHKNIISRAEVDGYQLITSTCFVRHLSRQFPFQGQQQSGQQKSVARHYLEVLYQKFSKLLTERAPKSFHGCSGSLLKEQRVELERLKVSTKELQEIQNQTRKEFDIGLPSEGHFKWQYCAGSSEYLRGHTCSLWILFHTLTVHEYLNPDPKLSGQHNSHNCSHPASTDEAADEPYKFMIKYSKGTERCDPENPEPALVGSRTSELFEEPLHFVLANVINFVRYYLSCTNCAAHFSCMVHNSPGLNLCNPRADDHILWLWEAHNRVNVRTRSTHSEDPSRPKHVFPVYEACPECYLERPTNGTAFEQMKFNRKTLVEFIVARYRKSAILNNKIKIEDLSRKQPLPPRVRSGSESLQANQTVGREDWSRHLAAPMM